MTHEDIAKQIAPLFTSYLNDNPDMEVIFLATTDGFPVLNQTAPGKCFEDDKMAAASSTLYSVSNAVSQQILNKTFKVTFIESEDGNVAFVALPLLEQHFVLAMSAGGKINIGSLRMMINRLAREIHAKINS